MLGVSNVMGSTPTTRDAHGKLGFLAKRLKGSSRRTVAVARGPDILICEFCSGGRCAAIVKTQRIKP